MEQNVSLNIPNDLYAVTVQTARRRHMNLNDYLLKALIQSVTKDHDNRAAARKKSRLRKSRVPHPGVPSLEIAVL